MYLLFGILPVRPKLMELAILWNSLAANIIKCLCCRGCWDRAIQKNTGGGPQIRGGKQELLGEFQLE